MSATEAPELIFVGGTGRSGTHILGRLIGAHSHFAGVPIEARFHCNKRGMPELLEGRVSLEAFLEKLRLFWWHRVRVDQQPRGLYNLMPFSDFEEAVDRFREGYSEDPDKACRRLYLDLLWRVAEREDKPALVEMSSHNVRETKTLLRLFPEAKVIHTFRDGRDAASSVTTKTWGPDTPVKAIDWWVERIRDIDRGLKRDGEMILGEGRFHAVLLDDLVHGDREGCYAALESFLGQGPDEGMRAFFESEMSADAAHAGRWREGLSWFSRLRVKRRYESTLEALQAEDNHVAAPLIASYERSLQGAGA